MRARLLVYVFLALAPGLAQALGLGKLQLESALNEPFEAKIGLLSPTVVELDSMQVHLADSEAFARAGIPRAMVLQELNFVVKETERGGDYIRVYSVEPIREPFLNFLLEVSWDNGRLYREYTVLLDPPIYSNEFTQQRLSSPTSSQRMQISAPEPEPEPRAIEDNQVVYNPEYTPPPASRAATPRPQPAPTTGIRTFVVGDQYGPVVTGDTLWSLAKNLRPDTSVSIQQMMFAILRANPEAFINGNINGLKRGQVLQLPDMPEIRSLDKAEAFAMTKNQNELWAEARSAVAAAAPERPKGVSGRETAKVTTESETREAPTTPEAAEPTGADMEVTEEGRPELRLVTPGEDGQAAGDGSGTESQQLNRELVLARESLDALTQENDELRGQIAETDEIIDDMKRLIDLKENELAMLQEQVAAAAAEAEAQAEPETEPETKAAEAPEDMAKTEPAKQAPATSGETAIDEGPLGFISGVLENITIPEWMKNIPETLKGIPAVLKDMPGQISGLVETAKSYLNYVAGAVGALLLLVLLSILKKRRAKAEEKAADEAAAAMDEPDIGLIEEAGNETDVVDSEADTLLPVGMEDESELPDDDVGFVEDIEDVSDQTQVMSPEEKTTVTATAVPAADEIEEDPLADVNVYLAYEDFDQAEQVVKQALEKEPDNLDFHTKLLEVYYAANNKKAYEEAAKVLHDKVDGEGDYWTMALAMWQEISPNRELFAEPVEGEEEEAPSSTGGGGIVNIAGDGEATESAIDFDLDMTTAADDTLDFDAPEEVEEEDILDVTAGTAGATGTLAEDEDEDDILDLTSVPEDGRDDKDAMAFSASSGSDNSEGLEASDIFDVSGGSSEEQSMDFTVSAGEEADTTSEIPSALDDHTLEFPLDQPGKDSSIDSGSADESSFDFSLDDNESPENESPENLSTLKLDTEETAAEVPSLDMDLSLDESAESSEETSGVDTSKLDLSLESEENAESRSADLDLLDTSSDFDEDKQDSDLEDDILDVSKSRPADEDLMNVSSTSQYELNDDDDLLDVTATRTSMDVPESENAGEETFAGNGLDLDLSLDESAESDQGSEAASDDYDELDLSQTMEMPKRPGEAKPSVEPEEDDSLREVNLELEDINVDDSIEDNETFTVSSDDEEQDIASQLDLAKAYIELGDIDNAKSILDDVITQGNDDQRQQAEELLGQI
ncbi:MAG TPA: FimV/HubP family polar landmark protein [Gammaproteobacteria bacterium]